MESIRRLSNVMRHGRRSNRCRYTVNPVTTTTTTTRGLENIKEIKLRLNETCIQKHGYLTKSPSRDRFRNKIARWHLRWIVLYDTLPLCEENPTLAREVELIYYKNHEEQTKSNLPIGRINLVGAKIFAQPGGMHGYRYVINIITETRSFHLCATQRIVYEEWLLKLRSHIDNSSDNDADIYPDDGYATWTRRGNADHLKNEEYAAPIKNKKLKKYFKTHDEATSPCQPFQLASKFFQPESETIVVTNFPQIATAATSYTMQNEHFYDTIATETRRPRSSTVPYTDDSGDEGIVCSSASSSMSNSSSNILSSSRFDTECGGFTGPTFFCGNKTLSRQISRSTGALQYTVNQTTNKQEVSLLNNTLPRKPFPKLNKTATLKKKLRQRYSVGATLSAIES